MLWRGPYPGQGRGSEDVGPTVTADGGEGAVNKKGVVGKRLQAVTK
jgi:hypothetical protein